MIFPQNLTNDTCRLLIRSVAQYAHVVHAVEHPPVNGFQSIPNVRQGPGNDHRHRIIDVGRLHFFLNVYRDDAIVLSHNVRNNEVALGAHIDKNKNIRMAELRTMMHGPTQVNFAQLDVQKHNSPFMSP